MFERFTDKARALVTRAQFEARSRNHNYIGTEHVLLALANSQDNNVAVRVLTGMGLDLDAVRADIDEKCPHGETSTKSRVPFTPRAKAVLELSLREALKLGHNYIGTEHLLLGLLAEGKGVAAKTLSKFGVAYANAYDAIVAILTMPAAAGAEDLQQLAQTFGRTQLLETLTEPVISPNCPQCRASLVETIAYKIVKAPQDGGAGHLNICFVYCEACGHTLLSRFEPEAE